MNNPSEPTDRIAKALRDPRNSGYDAGSSARAKELLPALHESGVPARHAPIPGQPGLLVLDPLTGEEIAALRKARGETQADFAEAVGVWGDEHTRQVAVSRWERGERTPSARYAHRLRELMTLEAGNR